MYTMFIGVFIANANTIHHTVYMYVYFVYYALTTFFLLYTSSQILF